jgi:3-(3-hydroxy-phenyl)propionate hydroxylase|tara:strand:- start:284 stop:1480 length:1197 start_codon:yes stop_codon:yes gene_type:complete
MTRNQIIIAGAGPVGTFVAFCLAEQGIDVLVLESAEHCETDMRASTFHPPTLSYLDQLGLAKPLIAQGLKAPIFQYRIRSSEEVLEFNLGELSDRLEFPFRLQCEQYKFARMLAEKLEEHPHAEILFNHKVLEVSQNNVGTSVEVNTPDGIRTYKGSYLIGADGANSIVRRQLGIDFSGFTYKEKFLTLSTKESVENYFNDLAYVNYVSDPKDWFVLLKAPSAWRILVPIENNMKDADIVSNKNIHSVFQRVLGESKKVETIHRTIYRVHQRVVDKMTHQRILLIGDSAHLNNPLGGLGMNSGLHDAWNLSQKLGLIINHKHSKDLLGQFDRQRRAVMNDFIQRQTIKNKKMIEESGETNFQSQWDEMRIIQADKTKRKEYMLEQSMTNSLQREKDIE